MAAGSSSPGQVWRNPPVSGLLPNSPTRSRTCSSSSTSTTGNEKSCVDIPLTKPLLFSERRSYLHPANGGFYSSGALPCRSISTTTGGYKTTCQRPLANHSAGERRPGQRWPERTRMRYSTKIVSNAVCCSFLFGYNIAVMNSCSNVIATYFEWCGNAYSADCKISNVYQSTVNASVFLGAMVGALCAKEVLSHGRRYGLIIANFLFVLGGIQGVVAGGLSSLVLSRVICGIGLGFVTVITPMYISEMSTAKDRGYYVTMHQIFISIGILVSIALGLFQTQNVEGDPSYRLDTLSRIWWRVLLGLNLVPSLMALVGFFCICTEETPTVLMHGDSLASAVSGMMKIHDTTNLAEVEETLVELKRAVEEGKQLRHINLFHALTEPVYRYAIIVGFVLAALQQLCGINVIVSASNDLFTKAGMKSSMVTLASTLVALSNVLVTVIVAPYMESWGRRRLLLVGLFWQGLVILPSPLCRAAQIYMGLNIADHEIMIILSLLSTVAFVSFFSLALGPVVWVYLSEIYPLEIRGSALAYCGFINWTCSLLIVFVTKFLDSNTAFNIFAGVCLVGWVFCYVFVIETSGTSLEDSPMSPRQLRSDSSLIRNSIRASPSVDEIRKSLRHAASSPCLHNPSMSSDSSFYEAHPHIPGADYYYYCGGDDDLGLSYVELDHASAPSETIVDWRSRPGSSRVEVSTSGRGGNVDRETGERSDEGRRGQNIYRMSSSGISSRNLNNRTMESSEHRNMHTTNITIPPPLVYSSPTSITPMIVTATRTAGFTPTKMATSNASSSSNSTHSRGPGGESIVSATTPWSTDKHRKAVGKSNISYAVSPQPYKKVYTSPGSNEQENLVFRGPPQQTCPFEKENRELITPNSKSTTTAALNDSLGKKTMHAISSNDSCTSGRTGSGAPGDTMVRIGSSSTGNMLQGYTEDRGRTTPIVVPSSQLSSSSSSTTTTTTVSHWFPTTDYSSRTTFPSTLLSSAPATTNTASSESNRERMERPRMADDSTSTPTTYVSSYNTNASSVGHYEPSGPIPAHQPRLDRPDVAATAAAEILKRNNSRNGSNPIETSRTSAGSKSRKSSGMNE